VWAVVELMYFPWPGANGGGGGEAGKGNDSPLISPFIWLDGVGGGGQNWERD
jgi:hypothetical protein